jgi:hypothetical protein
MQTMDPAAFLHHPLFQSVVLPLLLSLAGIGLIRRTAGAPRGGAAIGLAVLAATIWLMGWPAQPDSVMQKLPWIFAVAWLLGVGLDATLASRLLQWPALAIAWLAASWWLGSGGVGSGIALAFAGVAIIGCLLWSPAERADGTAAAVVASLGLAVLCVAAGSLALFQLALLLAAALGGAALWLWPTPRIRFGAAAVAVGGIAWLAIAQAALLLIAVRPAALVLLAAAFLAAPLASRMWRDSSRLGTPVAAAVLSGLLAGGSLALQAGAGADGAANGAGSDEDAYYETQRINP